MAVIVAFTLAEALDALAEHPGAMLLAGGTDAMVEINAGHRSCSDVVIALDRVAEMTSWRIDSDSVTIGAAVPYRTLLTDPLDSLLPALAQAARTVGSPQIRAVGTLGGNLGTCSPAGDTLPVLAALDAQVHLRSPEGARVIGVQEFMVGVKRSALVDSELIAAVTIPRRTGWQGYAKVGVRNAMVIATVSACVAVDESTRQVAIAIGSVAPTVIRCERAEEFCAQRVDWETGRLDEASLGELAAMVSDASRPIDDHRSSAAYRRHAVGTLAARLARRAFSGARTQGVDR